MAAWTALLLFVPYLSESLRLPKWLKSPPVLTNLPFFPALDIGKSCTVKELEGTCQTPVKCKGLGFQEAGVCTQGKSVCCAELTTCNDNLKSSVSYFTNAPNNNIEQQCRARLLLSDKICYVRVQLEQFSLAEEQVILNVNGNSEGGRWRLNKQRIGSEVLIPSYGASEIFLDLHSPNTKLLWRLKITQEKCRNFIRRQLKVRDNQSRCDSKKDSRRKMKTLRRRKKKQLFEQWKRKKTRRKSRSLLSPLVNWMLGKENVKEEQKDQDNYARGQHKIKVSSLLEIASKKVENIPSEFFQVVTASSLEVSEYSSNDKSDDLDNYKKRRRRKNIDISAEVPWAGFARSGNMTCPAYLVTSNKVLVEGRCNGDHMSLKITGYKVNLSTAIIHPYENLSLFTLTTHLPHSVETLCYPELVKYLTRTNGDIHNLNDLKEWIDVALGEKEEL